MATLSEKKLRLPSVVTEKRATPLIENAWKVLIVDDEEEIHAVTKLALKGFEFAGQPLEFIHSYSGADARKKFDEHSDIALVLLDVVMETEHAGLDVVQYVRKTLNNKLTRIVLRTGQPGQAPEKKIITEFDINDYKEKTELTSMKLYTLICASLRSYRDMVALEENRKGLRKIIDATADIFSVDSMHGLAEGALDQLLSLLHVKVGSSFFGRKVDSLAVLKNNSEFEILAGTGCYSKFSTNTTNIPATPPDVQSLITQPKRQGTERIVSHHIGRRNHESILYVAADLSLDHFDRDLVELYTRNVGIVFENLHLHQQVDEAQREIVFRLGEAVETRSMETGDHLKRVAAISKFLAQKIGLGIEEVELLEYAAPLHDVGKIGIPDAILNKPGKFDPDEWEIMKTHSALGHKMLSDSDKPILKAGAIIALEHHEKWDGSGYPAGKAGEDIHIYGRITALADVFDALRSKRVYKKEWQTEEIYTYISEQHGKHFQPELVDILVQNRDEIEEILDDISFNFSDKFSYTKPS